MQSSSTVSCQKETPWLFGSTLTRYLKMNKFNGLTGNIEFDPVTGLRTNLTLNIVDRTKTSVDLVILKKKDTLLFEFKLKIKILCLKINFLSLVIGKTTQCLPKSLLKSCEATQKKKTQFIAN